MDETKSGWSKNQRNWFARIAITSNKLSIRCHKRTKFYNRLAKMLVHHNPDGIWRYVMIMSCGWAKCSDVWSDLADQFIEKVREIDCENSLTGEDE